MFSNLFHYLKFHVYMAFGETVKVFDCLPENRVNVKLCVGRLVFELFSIFNVCVCVCVCAEIIKNDTSLQFNISDRTSHTHKK